MYVSGFLEILKMTACFFMLVIISTISAVAGMLSPILPWVHYWFVIAVSVAEVDSNPEFPQICKWYVVQCGMGEYLNV